MYLHHFYETSLAQASYMVACQATGEAAVIDPARNIEGYLKTAREQGFQIVAAVETHIHADFVSGVTELARRTGATIYHSIEGVDNGGYEWSSDLPVKGLRDQDTIQLGKVQLRAVHTPGHTPEHMAYELIDGAVADRPMGIFTGDFVFVGDVGRPDLLEKAVGVVGSAEEGARQMFSSIHRFKKYADYVQIWPGHGSGSACGKALGAVPTSTVGYERLFNPAFQPTEETAFINLLLDGQPEPPAYFAKMKEVNKTGMTPLQKVPSPVEMQLTGDEIAELAQDNQTMVIDTRRIQTFATGSIPGTINLPYPDMFTEWLGRLADYEKTIYLIAEPHQFAPLRKIMLGMGMDNLKGFFATSVIDSASKKLTYDTQSPSVVDKKREHDDVQVLDVRYIDEWDEAHIPNAKHIPLPKLAERADELNPKKPVAVHCRSGKRSAIASSMLINQGFDVINVEGGFINWEQQNLETTKDKIKEG
ncbi:MBL fold metallo-hydrolase [Virgibacillus chiguensis]|uniref:Hydroxyacylglutathione hydrolase n=1 Tax=Virgibacillus chiguensis TaxID=411959 RepID=A0A1M5VCZ9_9BACI|nr:MBL fold metallo-hydrolase [Virgibacillus chiguensis]SHH73120.1 hydroxyacylglutathione hydrolase [Virgibacillus chiguensis]